MRTDVFVRERSMRFGCRDTEETQGRRPCEGGGRDGNAMSTRQRTPRTAGLPQQPGERHETDSSTESSEGAWPS